MKKSKFSSHSCAVLSIVLFGCLTIGCHKRQSGSPPPDNTTIDTNNIAKPVSQSAAKQTASQTLPVSDQVAEVNAALKAKDYQTAAGALSIPQQSALTMTPEQIEAYNNAKRSVAQQVIAAAAAGDPNAKAALAKMQEDAKYRH